jgi:ECF sigma factor
MAKQGSLPWHRRANDAPNPCRLCPRAPWGGAPVVSLDEAATLSVQRASDLIAVNDALTRLSELDARKGRVVELRFFGGLSVFQLVQPGQSGKSDQQPQCRISFTNTGAIVSPGDFGRIVSTSSNPRLIQLALKLNW